LTSEGRNFRLGNGGMASIKKLADIAATDFSIQLAGWAVASTLQTEKFYDLTGAITYWTTILRAYSFANKAKRDAAGSVTTRDGTPAANGEGQASVRQKVSAAMVLLWSLRLGLFLGWRGWKYGDSRFEKVKYRPKAFLVYWMVQGFWCLLTPLPTYLLLSRTSKDTAPLGFSDYASWLGWVVGFVTEAVADAQKSLWKDAGNTGFMRSGLWRYSQHPNYFGEILLWASACVTCTNGLESWLAKICSLASPAFVAYLLMFVSGVPMLQRAAQKKYGRDPAFLAYRATTSLLVPMPPRRTI